MIDSNYLLLITDASDELIDIAFRSQVSKFICGVPERKFNGKMLGLLAKYESNLLKKKR